MTNYKIIALIANDQTDQVGSIDIVADGTIVQVQWFAGVGIGSASNRTPVLGQAELSFIQQNSFTANDTRNSISTIIYGTFTSYTVEVDPAIELSNANGWSNLIVPTEIPVKAGERLYVHNRAISGLFPSDSGDNPVGVLGCYVLVRDKGSTAQRRLRS